MRFHSCAVLTHVALSDAPVHLDIVNMLAMSEKTILIDTYFRYFYDKLKLI